MNARSAHPQSPQEALDAILADLRPVESESIDLAASSGRVLADPLRADRPSPPCDVSAMDGYAVRRVDLSRPRLPVPADILIGRAAPALSPGSALRIVTGAAVPADADAVIRREDVTEGAGWIEIGSAATAKVSSGDNIRRLGENLAAGEIVISGGLAITAATAGALSAFGYSRVRLHRKVRVGLLITGDELLDAADHPEPWQIRDSNGPALCSLLNGAPWIQVVRSVRCADDPAALRDALAGLLADCDAIVLTGGVSMGDRDYVPRTVADCGGRIVFHKLPIRPGKPILGALGPAGQPILGLPGNPVAVLTCAVRFASPLFRRLGGFARPIRPPLPVTLVRGDEASIKLWWHRLVQLRPDGRAELVPGRGSGDIVSAARADGFIEIPPGVAITPGPWPFYHWEI